MRSKSKMILVSSIILNIILIAALVTQYIKQNTFYENLYYSEVQSKLVELDGVIQHQKENHWSDPNLVTMQLEKVLNGMEVATSIGQDSKWLSGDDQRTMQRLGNQLRQYPHDDLYKFSVVNQQDQKRFEQLRAYLRKAGFGMNMTINNEWETFVAQTEKLSSLLNYDR